MHLHIGRSRMQSRSAAQIDSRIGSPAGSDVGSLLNMACKTHPQRTCAARQPLPSTSAHNKASALPAVPAEVAVAALPEMLIPQVPDAPVPVRVGT